MGFILVIYCSKASASLRFQTQISSWKHHWLCQHEKTETADVTWMFWCGAAAPGSWCQLAQMKWTYREAERWDGGKKGGTDENREMGMRSCEGLVNADSAFYNESDKPLLLPWQPPLALRSSLPSFQHATTYPCCLSVSRACGCVRRLSVGPWMNQANEKESH